MKPILVSWPDHPSLWYNGVSRANVQIAKALFEGLRKRHDNVQWVMWNTVPDDIPEGARLYTHTSWPVGTGGLELVRRVKAKGGQVYFIMNDPLYDYVVDGGVYNLHGHYGFDNRGKPGPNHYAEQQLTEARMADAMFCMTSDIGMELWNGTRPGGQKRREFMRGTRFIPFVSPIDWNLFQRQVFAPTQRKFLTMFGESPRKRQQMFRSFVPASCVTLPPGFSWNRPETTYPHVLKCFCMAHPSLQEGFPYLGLEGIAHGLLLFGGENWWNGLGWEELIWRENDLTGNLEKTAFLLKGDLDKLYKEFHAKIRARGDMSWDYALDTYLTKEPEELQTV